MLVAEAYHVTATTQSPERAAWIEAAGAGLAIVDVYDAGALHDVLLIATRRGDPSTDRSGGRLRTGRPRPQCAAAGSRHENPGRRRGRGAPGASLPTASRGPTPRRPSLTSRRSPLLDPSEARRHRPVRRPRARAPRYGNPGRRRCRVALRPLLWSRTSDATLGRPPAVEVTAAARAAVLAVDRGGPGPYNVVDDGRPVSNVRAKWELGWQP